MCSQCAHGHHGQCWGLVGPMTTHPDSLPRCSCLLAAHRPTPATATTTEGNRA